MSSNCKKLLEETNESFYWLGFILADGCFSLDRTSPTLSIAVHEQDISVLERFSEYIGGTTIRKSSDTACVSVRVYHSAEDVRLKYGFNWRKTYNPSEFETFSKYDRKLLLSLLVGIIDGDGSITKKHKDTTVWIRITAYKDWDTFYEKLLTHLNIPHHIYYYKSRNAISVEIMGLDLIRELFNEVQGLDVPYMHRKWDKIWEVEKSTRNCKKIAQYSKNGRLLATFDKIVDAENETGIDGTCICKCCKGTISSAGGYIWKYQTDVENSSENKIEKKIEVPTSKLKHSVLQYDLDDNLIREFESVSAAARHMNCSRDSIIKNLQNKTKQFRGFVWKYKNELNK